MSINTEYSTEQDRLDDQLIQQTLDNIDGGVILPEQDRDLDIGDKAEDAVDFADLSDDDLADDEDAGQGLESAPAGHIEGNIGTSPSVPDERDVDLSNENATDFDDLFGEVPSSPMDSAIRDAGSFDLGGTLDHNSVDGQYSSLFGAQPIHNEMVPSSHRSAPDKIKRTGFTKEEQMQQSLFAMSKMNSDAVPQPVENAEELLNTLWPKYKRSTVPYFMELVPGRRMQYRGKSPPRPPKPLQTNKLNLEVAPDQEKNFKVSLGTSKRTREELENMGIVAMGGEDDFVADEEEVLDMDSDYERDVMGNISWQDLQIACQDWDVASLTDETLLLASEREQGLDQDMEWPPAKVRAHPSPTKASTYVLSLATKTKLLAGKAVKSCSNRSSGIA